MVRATHGVHRGSYYYEVEILKSTPPKAAATSSNSEMTTELPSHVRIGWSTRLGELQAPVGFDQYSFGYRDEAGTFHSMLVNIIVWSPRSFLSLPSIKLMMVLFA